MNRREAREVIGEVVDFFKFMVLILSAMLLMGTFCMLIFGAGVLAVIYGGTLGGIAVAIIVLLGAAYIVGSKYWWGI